MARKITELAVNAFLDGENFHRDNTRVYRDEVTGKMVMELHGNVIAMTVENDEDTMEITDAGWCTKTTYERLGHLLYAWTNGIYNASMRKGGTLINHLTGNESPLFYMGDDWRAFRRA